MDGADLIMDRGGKPLAMHHVGVSWRFASQRAVVAIAVISAGIMLVLDDDRFAFLVTTAASVFIAGISALVLRKPPGIVRTRAGMGRAVPALHRTTETGES